MVFVNIIALFSLLLFLGFIKYILHKKIKTIFLVFLFSLLPLISVLRRGVYESGDFNLHIYRSISFYESLRHFNFFPSWGDGLNAGFGYPIFLIINPIPYYAISLLHLTGFTFIASMKLYIIITFIFSGIFMYLFSKKLFKNELAAFTSSIFYLYSPYHLVDMHFRVDVGQLASFMLFPLVCLFFYKSLTEKENINYIFLGLTFGIFILCHQGIALISLLFFSIFILSYFLKNGLRKSLSHYKIIYSLLIAFLISGYALLPYFTYTKYTLMNLNSTFKVSLLQLNEILYSPWRFGLLFQGPNGELSHLIGYVQIFVLAITFYLLLTKKIKKKYYMQILFLFITSIFFIFMLTEYSRILWETVPLLENLLFSSRMLFMITFLISVLAGYLSIQYTNKRFFIYFLILITIFLTILNWGNRRTIPSISDNNLYNNLPKSTYEGEGYAYLIPRWVINGVKWEHISPLRPLDIIYGQGITKTLTITPQYHEYIVKSNSDTSITENTWYFPGWKLFVNGKETEIYYSDKQHPGLINFSLPRGIWKIEIVYEDLFILKLAKVLSIITFSISILITVFLYSRKKVD